MGTSNLHLVDEHGQPLPHHITEAVQRIEPKIYRRFCRHCDPAELSNSMEAGARRIAQYEKENGRLRNVFSFAGRTLSNAAISLVRPRSREKPLSSKLLAHSGEDDTQSSPEAIDRRVKARELIGQLNKQECDILLLYAGGFTGKEIARRVAMTEHNVYQTIHRLKERLKPLV